MEKNPVIDDKNDALPIQNDDFPISYYYNPNILGIKFGIIQVT